MLLLCSTVKYLKKGLEMIFTDYKNLQAPRHCEPSERGNPFVPLVQQIATSLSLLALSGLPAVAMTLLQSFHLIFC